MISPQQKALARRLTYLEQKLQVCLGEQVHSGVSEVAVEKSFESSCDDESTIDSLHRLAELFGLSEFECQLLLLCAAPELDSRFYRLLAQANNNEQKPFATFSLALAILDAPDWNALTPNASLRRWNLIHVEHGATLMHASLRIDERVLHAIVGVGATDERLRDIITPITEQILPLTDAELEVSNRIVTTVHSASDSQWSIMEVIGDDRSVREQIFVRLCAHLDCAGLSLNCANRRLTMQEAAELSLLITREALLSNCMLYCDIPRSAEADEALCYLIERVGATLIVGSNESIKGIRRQKLTFTLPRPALGAQVELWHDVLGENAAELNGQVSRIASHFHCERGTMSELALQWNSERKFENAESGALLWRLCKQANSLEHDPSIHRIVPRARWSDLVLPEAQKEALRDLASQVRHRFTVYERWGFKQFGGRGTGISALFFGASGTGKTLAAEVVASELDLDLYQVDLSQVISKYIGETEKNLRRVFLDAERSGAVLLFDEADALFGKRSEVKDSHDRYANVEVSFLLQQMEQYRGLAILTTNMKAGLDQAFLRRLSIAVQFPFPTTAQRTEIWRKSIPESAPSDTLDLQKLARLNIAGGNIRTIALNAAFLAAESGKPISMSHMLRSAKAEYGKLERATTETEFAGWV